jgi:hypothetical protein
VFAHEPLDSVDLDSRETAAALQSDRIEPEFGHIIVAFDMDVGRFVSIASVEEESVWANTQNGRH